MKQLPILDTSAHKWTFHRTGGIFQAQIDDVADLRHLRDLDPKLWVALSCPVDGLEMDRQTLTLIDTDEDGRVRIEELLAAVEWTMLRLSDASTLYEGGPLPLSAIRTDDPEGKKIRASAHRILKNVGLPDSVSITVEVASNSDQIFSQSKLNGDGVIAADAADADSTKKLIEEIINTLGATKDRGGKDGVTGEQVNSFFKQLATYEAWWKRGEDDVATGKDVLPLGEDTPDGYTQFSKVEDKIDDYFRRCQLTAFDERAASHLNRDPQYYEEIASEDLSESLPDIAALPLAMVNETVELPSIAHLNPEWRERMRTFHEAVKKPLGVSEGEELTFEEWKQIKARFAEYREWLQSKPDTDVETLKITRVREILESNEYKNLENLLALDAELAPEMQAIDGVQKLARYHRDLVTLVNNYVNFSEFYDPAKTAIFQAGQLFLDGRECHLCLRVDDPAKHAVLASLSRAFVTYCECRRKDSESKFYIAAIFTAGSSSDLIVGRNGVFRDRSNKLWDVTIVRIIENPISIHEAFFKPYVRLGRFIGEKIERWATDRDKAMQKQMETGVETGEIAPATSATTEDGNKKSAGGLAAILAAGGIAIGALGAGLASLFRTLKALTWWELPLVLVGAVLMISLPSMVIAYLKLRKRTLAPLLDASGWAVNGSTHISARLGRRLTEKASLPPNAKMIDAKKLKNKRIFYGAIGIAVIVACAAAGYFLWQRWQ